MENDLPIDPFNRVQFRKRAHLASTTIDDVVWERWLVVSPSSPCPVALEVGTGQGSGQHGAPMMGHPGVMHF